MDLLFFNANQVVTCAADGAAAKYGKDMNDLRVIEGGAVGIKDGKIVYVGDSDGVTFKDADRAINAEGKVLLPGFVDSHTHLVFAGAREKEFARRIAGETYAEIGASGGGINTTVKAVRAASKVELTEYALHRLDSCLEFGTTTVEIKTGYGLDEENEKKMLEVINELRALHVVEIVPTFLGAHVVPFDYKERRDEYMRLLLDVLIPHAAEHKLARFVDVFIEQNAYTIEEARAICAKAKDLGFEIKIHADQITAGGGAELAAEFGAASADHLDHTSPEGRAAMKQSGTVATLLPGVSLFLGEPFPDARPLIDEGLAVALATDANPGSCMSENIQLMMSMAAMRMHMTVEETISAVTINGAAALRMSGTHGSLEVGKQADVLMFDVPTYERIPYHFGINHLSGVVKNGNVVMEKRYANA
ncbi:MAG: imidazolonepropionase [Ectothiorhodospiraceae bacterium]|nr:imidazolonepropionase [Ectothiorhodospiraceae bacterium]